MSLSSGISYGSSIIEFCKIADVARTLNMFSTDSNGNYILWDIPIAPSFIQAQVDWANIYVSALTSSNSGGGDTLYPNLGRPLAYVLATDIASLRTLIMGIGGWIDTAFNYSIEGINVQKGTITINAIQNLANSLKADIDRITIMFKGQVKAVDVSDVNREFYSTSGTPFIP